jgi:predicted PurR-regulated permease PerM
LIEHFLRVGELATLPRLEQRMKSTEPEQSSSSNGPALPPAEGDEEAMPLPADVKVIFLGGIFFILSLAALYTAAEIVWPLIFAFVLSLLLNPLLRLLDRLHIPRVLGALLLVAAVLALVVGLGTAISGPAASWAAKLPDGLPRLFQRLRFLESPFAALQHFWQQVESFAGWQNGTNSSGSALLTSLLTGTRSFASGFFTTLLFLFFLLVAGEIFLQRLVEIMPRFSGKRQVVDIANQIESDISAYLLTITAMNAAVGIATAAVMWLTGVGDPALWGTIAFLLNFVPILGPLLGVLIFLLAGALAAETVWLMLLPAGLYLGIHVIEGETITPMLLARRFTLNPVLVIVSLVFWFWMWGVPGAILSAPMLAITKIVCDRVRPLAAFGHFLEG